MSKDSYASLLVALPAPRTAFWAIVGESFACRRGHEGLSGKPYCPECGGKVETRPKEEPTEALVAYAKAQGMTPEQAWDLLCGVEAKEPAVRLFEGSSYHTCETRRFLRPLFGKRLHYIADECEKEGGLAVLSHDAFLLVAAEVREAAKAFGLQGEPAVHLTMYVSY